MMNQKDGGIRMPTICIFYGIVIRMFWDDHASPHFHALYDEYLEWASDLTSLDRPSFFLNSNNFSEGIPISTQSIIANPL